MDRRLIIGLVAAALAMLALPALAAPDHAKIAERLQAGIVLPGYKVLAKDSENLSRSLEQYCTGTGADIDEVAGAFNRTMDAWQAVQHIRHGPVMDKDRHSRIQFWPDKRGKTGKHVRRLLVQGVPGDLAPPVFANKSVAVQGLQALERLIFDKPNLEPNASSDSAVSACALGTAIGANIAGIATETAQAYQRADDPTQAIRAYVMDLVSGLEVISRLKLGGPNGKRPRYKLSENWRSERSLRNLAINVRTLRSQYTILAADDLRGHPSHDLILRQFALIEDDVTALGHMMRPVLESDTGPQHLHSLALSIDDLRELVIVTLTEHLGINLGFNSLDGD